MAPSVPTARPRSTLPEIDRLQRLAAARGVDHLELEVVLLEDAGLGAEMGDGGVPVAALADGELELIGGGCARQARARQQRGAGEREMRCSGVSC